MKNGFRQSMAWLHTWSGLLLGWILFAIFLTGTASYFRPEISHWMRPEQHSAAVVGASVQPMVDYLGSVAPGGFTLNLPDRRNPVATAFWRDPTAAVPGQRGGFRSTVLDPVTGTPVVARDTRGGEFFYRVHFQLHYVPVIWGRWIASLCALFMLVAIVSGIIMHKRIFADFFTFRLRKGQRSWMDAHAVTAVLALPYHLMITFTGLVTLMMMFLPWGAQVAYDNNLRTFNTEIFGAFENSSAAGPPLHPVAIDPLLHEATAIWGGGSDATRVILLNPARGVPTVEITRGGDGRLSTARDVVRFDARTGALLNHEVRDSGTAQLHGVLYGLHLGRFAEPLLRTLFFISGLLGTAMVGTGTVLWAVKTRQAATRTGQVGFGTWLVEVLNLGAVAGLPVAMAGFFWLNRFLPLGMHGRGGWEVDGFFILWGLCFLHAAVRRGCRQGWVEQFALAALLGIGLPVLNALTTNSHLGVTIPRGDWLLAGFDLTLAALGVLVGYAAWRLAWQDAQRARRVVRKVPAIATATTARDAA